MNLKIWRHFLNSTPLYFCARRELHRALSAEVPPSDHLSEAPRAAMSSYRFTSPQALPRPSTSETEQASGVPRGFGSPGGGGSDGTGGAESPGLCACGRKLSGRSFSWSKKMCTECVAGPRCCKDSGVVWLPRRRCAWRCGCCTPRDSLAGHHCRASPYRFGPSPRSLAAPLWPLH